jgi:integrase
LHFGHRPRSHNPEEIMPAIAPWNLDPTRLLSRRELNTVLADLVARAPRSANDRRNRIIVRLACCCGLRVSEIARLQLDDVVVDVQRPHLRLRREITKGRRARNVPLWWDAGTLADLHAWKAERMAQGARRTAPFVCSVQSHRRGQPLQRAALRRRFLTACKGLGLARLQTLTIHHGRHTFVSHALAGGRSLAEVRAAAGHASLLTTSVYLHVALDDDGELGDLFGLKR